MRIGIIDLIPVFSQLAESIHVLNDVDIHVNPLCVLVLFFRRYFCRPSYAPIARETPVTCCHRSAS